MSDASAGRVLITGGAGFLGINLTRYLLDRGYDVTSLDIAPYDYADTRDRVRIVTGDIRDMVGSPRQWKRSISSFTRRRRFRSTNRTISIRPMSKARAMSSPLQEWPG